MTNIEKIRQEIERLKKWSESSKKEWIAEGYNQNAFAEDCRIKSFDKLLAFIDSLPEEKEVKMNNESVIAETIVPLSIMDETIYDAAPMLVKQQLAQAVGLRLLHEGFLDFDVQKFDFNRTRVRCKLSFYDLKKR